ncbi:MAG: 1-deoxy-D-xylulose-5-phosphate reductoisomerase [Acidimicrobiaceae bacterium]|nr:1-deoxy-D-xylulose-5-phosphate reductoisomerase [Acidimicrobiaceae bacterium]MBT5849394.1 1-deoxy-D-xylulose-5-phosphate reductoisomerase [Acidimicrobiaceae bacterium]
MTTTIAVLGSSGSIGTQTLDVVRALPADYRVVALGVATSVDTLVEQAKEFRPDVVAIGDEVAAAGLAERLPAGTELLVGADAMAEAAVAGDVVINGVVGFAGLSVTMATLEAGKRLGLANKESLIAAGPVVQRAWATPGAELVPVDSEHCAVHQCLRANEITGKIGDADRVRKVVLTASGGPFRGRSRADLEGVTIDHALAHPTWSMGPKITIDSSTLINKGLEVIEAHGLFGIGFDDIDVVVHPQSIIHSMVTFTDGATIAQLSKPDMRLCIGYALAFPDRLDVPYGDIDWSELSRLDFQPPDLDAFPGLGLAYDAGRAGETAPAWFSAANEVAVDAFLKGQIRWVDIADVVDGALQRWPGTIATDVGVVLDIDRRARDEAAAVIQELVVL